MLKFELTRKKIYPSCVFGTMKILNFNMEFLTMEAKDPRGHNPVNPSLSYALKDGIYDLYWSNYSYFPFVPHIICRGYKQISFCMAANMIKPGNIAVGTMEEFGIITGHELVFEKIERIIKQYRFNVGKLVIKYSDKLEYPMIQFPEIDYGWENPEDHD